MITTGTGGSMPELSPEDIHRRFADASMLMTSTPWSHFTSLTRFSSRVPVSAPLAETPSVLPWLVFSPAFKASRSATAAPYSTGM